MGGPVQRKGKHRRSEKKFLRSGAQRLIERAGTTKIRLPSSPVKLLALHVGPKVGICEVGMGANFGEDYFNCHESL